MINLSHLAIVVGLLAIVLFWIFWSVRRHPVMDGGDGLGRVIIPPPKTPVPVARPLLFFAFMIIFAVIAVAVLGPLASTYSSVVVRLVLWVLPAPALVAPYATHFETGLRIMISGSIVALALVLSATGFRKVTVAMHAPIYLGLAMLLDCLVVVVSATTRLPIAYVGIEGIILNLLLWATVMLRVFFTTVALPRPSQVPVFRRVYRTATLHAILVGLAALAVLVVATAVVLRLGAFGHELYILLGFMTYSLLWTLFVLFLRFSSPFRPPPATASTPGIHVIMCAYNESPGILDTLESIDVAALAYAGDVRVTLADDGSEDDTVSISRRAMEAFRAAKGEVITCAHGGKSAALNAALARVAGPIAVRIDADVVISRDAFTHLPRWFEDPSVGNVGGVTFPRSMKSWIHKMRLIECVYGYLFVRPALMVIDAIPCIPGTFQAFRPDPVRAVGGMVIGMNGEDADLTLQLGRLGYRAVLDRDIVIHEDVPSTLKEYREQRLRWYRSGFHLFARHSPFQGASVGPRVWLSTVRAAIFRFMMLVRPIVYLYAAVWALEQPSATRNIWFVFVLFGCAVAPMLLCTAVEAIAHGYARYLPWFLLWFPIYMLLRRTIAIESLITLPTRPVVVPWPSLASGRRKALLPEPSEA
jgi:cellulose synthase/poly-beta-1,6-N-acetylglucosamine synthase-like glycosyltransferase